MLGGLFDIRLSANRHLSDQIFKLVLDPKIALVHNHNRNHTKGEDQRFLAKNVHPLIKNLSLNHDSYTCRATGGEA
jgi:hypothetical protein